MKKHYILLVFIFAFNIAKAQIIYDYDDAGNRVLRRTSGPLPVTLISFTATKVSSDSEVSTALLTWQTSSEINADRFDIERSQNGKKWSNIGNVTASGDKKTKSWYSFSDRTPIDGENLYRLKMIDKDGTFSFSRIQSVYFDNEISFYPNPVKDLLKIKGVFTGAPVAGTVQLFNTSGKSILSLGNIPTNGIDMSNLPTGIYMLKIAHKDGTFTIRKVVKE